MPIFNVTIPDSSPLIYYTPTWVPTVESLDSGLYQNSANHTAHVSSAAGDFLSFKFNGTGFWLFGSTWSNHGNYTVAVNNQQLDNLSGNDANRDYKVPLSAHTGLSSGQEQQVTVTNIGSDGSNYFDFDYAIVQVGDGNPNTSTSDQFLDDRATSNISYSSNWSDTPSSRTGNGYFMGTGRTTTTPGGSVNITFWGNTVQVFGATNDEFQVSLDGATKGQYNVSETTPVDRPSGLLYFSTGFGPGAHVLQLTKQGASGTYLDLDEVQITSWATNTSSAAVTQPSGQPTPKSSTDATPIIVGAIVGAAALLAALVLGVFFWRRHRRAAMRRQDMDYFERKAPSRGTLLDAGLPNVSPASPAIPLPAIATPAQPAPIPHFAFTPPTPVVAHGATAANGLDHDLPEMDAPPPEYSEAADGATGSGGPRREAAPLPRKQRYGLGWATDSHR